MNKFRRIVEGWKNFAFKSPLIELLAIQRAKICSTCDLAVEQKFLESIGKEPIKEVKGMVCGNCNCPLSAKLRSVKEECPEGNW